MTTKSALLVSLFFSLSSHATNLNYATNGTDMIVLPMNGTTTLSALSDLSSNEANDLFDSFNNLKTIQVIKIIPSAKMIEEHKAALDKFTLDGGEHDYSKGIQSFKESQGAVDLGMSDVPVLDQGKENTCLTFAATAAVDVRFHVGDYVDQQCTIAVNLGLGKNLWNGAQNYDIFNTLSQYGIIPKNQCFGSSYPDKFQVVNASQYIQKSDKTYSSQIKPVYNYGSNLSAIKSYINAGHHVLITFALAHYENDRISVNGFDITVDAVQKSGGLWACSQPSHDMNYCMQQGALHEVIVTGYDDRQQLLKIRNSWGTRLGHDGEYYMTYSFYNIMALDYTILY